MERKVEVVFVQHWCEHQEDHGKRNKEDRREDRNNQCASRASQGLCAHCILSTRADLVRKLPLISHFTGVTGAPKESHSDAAAVCLKPGDDQRDCTDKLWRRQPVIIWEKAAECLTLGWKTWKILEVRWLFGTLRKEERREATMTITQWALCTQRPRLNSQSPWAGIGSPPATCFGRREEQSKCTKRDPSFPRAQRS